MWPTRLATAPYSASTSVQRCSNNFRQPAAVPITKLPRHQSATSLLRVARTGVWFSRGAVPQATTYSNHQAWHLTFRSNTRAYWTSNSSYIRTTQWLWSPRITIRAVAYLSMRRLQHRWPSRVLASSSGQTVSRWYLALQCPSTTITCPHLQQTSIINSSKPLLSFSVSMEQVGTMFDQVVALVAIQTRQRIGQWSLNNNSKPRIRITVISYLEIQTRLVCR